MGSGTDADIAAFQGATGIKPARGENADRLERMAAAAFELIQAIALEKSGIRDGDGMWHGSDPLRALASTIADLEASRYSEASAAHESAGRDQKASLLAHYANRAPTHFVQIDGFVMADGGDGVMHADEDGHCLMGGETWELMHGANVRALIQPETPTKDASAMLRKIADWIDTSGFKPHLGTRFGPDARQWPAFDPETGEMLQ